MNHTIFDSNENEAVRDWSTDCSADKMSFSGQKLHKQMWKLLSISFIQCLLLVFPSEPHSHLCEIQYGV